MYYHAHWWTLNQCISNKKKLTGEGTKTDCSMCNQSLDVRSTTLLVRQKSVRARNDEWVGARPDVGSTVLLWT
jgi:hypothetical protein